MRIHGLILPAVIAALPLSYSPVAGGKTASAPYVKGDLNGDLSLDQNDIVMFNSYLRGKLSLTDAQFTAADINSDGRTDIYDLMRLKKNIYTYSAKPPEGTWLAYSSSGTDYYYFSGEKCTVTSQKTGAVSSYDCNISGNSLTLKNSSGEKTGNILRTGSKSFTLARADGSGENFVYYDSSAIDYSKLLTGDYYAKNGSSTRAFNIRGVSGTVNGKPFTYKMKGSDLEFDFSDGTTLTAKMTRVDSMHFDLKWSSGITERFTLRNITVKNGITYVNGVLIANKSYSLPSSYNPGAILPEALSSFYTMQADAAKAGLNLWITSGYRSYSYQAQLYNSYAARDGYAKADTYSARPGYSEHQTGLAMDINVAGDQFGLTPESKWLAANCYKYGFVIRYMNGKQNITGYKYEPWHVRYLGKDLAKEVYDSGLCLEEFFCIDSKYKN